MAYSFRQSLKGSGAELDRVLNREIFLYFLDLEVKRSRRYQNFFSILIVKLKELSDQGNGKSLETCYQRLSTLIKQEIRDSDILGTLGEKKLAVLLPYADMSAGGYTRSRFESSLKYYDFNREGYQVVVEQVSFPSDGTDTPDLIRKLVETEAANS
jgi:GGDEF domain-containing protein